MSIKCPYCGKERPSNYYGGVGPCSCEAFKEASDAEHKRIKEEAAVRKAKEHEILHHKAVSCDHEWAGGYNLAYTRCRKCGISLSNYYNHR